MLLAGMWSTAALLLLARAENPPTSCTRLQRQSGACTCSGHTESSTVTLRCASSTRTSVTVSVSAARLVQIRCDSTEASASHRSQIYEALYHYNLSVDVVAMSITGCPLPHAPLVNLTSRIGVTGVNKFSIHSQNEPADVIDKDFLVGANYQSLSLHGIHVIKWNQSSLRTMTSLRRLRIVDSAVILHEGVFDQTTQLQSIEIMQTNITNIPAKLFRNLTELRYLSLADNLLKHLPVQIFTDLQNLRKLDLYKNKLITLPERVFSSLHELTELQIQYNPLEELDDGVFEGLANLTKLNMNGIRPNEPVRLPAALFTTLPRLKQLYMNGLGLQSLPNNTFRPLKDTLAVLNIGSNSLRDIPTALFKDLRTLKRLNMERNELSSLSRSIFIDTGALEDLDLSHNRIVTIEKTLFTGVERSLRKLDLSNNKIKHVQLTPRLIALERLDLSHNLLSEIPDGTRLISAFKQLDLRFNEITYLGSRHLEFTSEGADVFLQHNGITTINLDGAAARAEGNTRIEPNLFYIETEALHCDCSVLALKLYISRTSEPLDGGWNAVDRRFRLQFEKLTCAGPVPLQSVSLQDVQPDQLLCRLSRHCPSNCSCTLQSSSASALVDCSIGRHEQLHLDLHDHRVAAVSLTIQHATINVINLSDISSTITALDLSHNEISHITAPALPLGLRRLELDHNHLTGIPDIFLDFMRNASIHGRLELRLGDNPYDCNCGTVPLLRFIKSDVARRRSAALLDADSMRCERDDRPLLQLTERDLCPGSEALVIGLCLLAVVVSVAMLVAAVLYYRYGSTIKVWLYAHRLCLWWVSERELDADKKYDVFLSYSHLDERFVVETLVPGLEQGQPRYTVCLHFRDWLAGEWIANQIERSVQESRRVIVVMSQNFVDSAWGRLEFAAAHKQALQDKTNRLIVLVYGEVPDTSVLDSDLRLYLTMNTYLKWGDPRFWQRLRYALPHPSRCTQAHPTLELNSDCRAGISPKTTQSCTK